MKSRLRVEASPREQSALLTAALRAGDEARLRELLSLGLNPESEGLNADGLGMGASLIACDGASMSLGCLRALLEAGASPDARSKKKKETALTQFLARLADDNVTRDWPVDALARVETLLDAGADPNACCFNHDPLLALALKTRGNLAFVEGGRQILRTLLAKGADPNKSAVSYPPLVIACKNEDVEQVAALLCAGADPRGTARNGWGGSALSVMNSKADSALVKAIRGMLNSVVERLELAVAVGSAPGRSPTPRV